MATDFKYDVFLSRSSQDKAVLGPRAKRLRTYPFAQISDTVSRNLLPVMPSRISESPIREFIEPRGQMRLT